MSDPAATAHADIEFFWDPVCPFAWITSRWVEQVAEATGYAVRWRFISLRLLNRDKDYATEFPPEYEQGHTAGLRMLRVAAAVRAELGDGPLGGIVAAYGHSVWDRSPEEGDMSTLSTPGHVRAVLAEAGVADRFADALDDSSRDAELEAETELALERTGRDVGTPIITFRPPDGPSFFGPVISRVPHGDDAVRLWDAVTTLATFDGFSELKRSLREMPNLRMLGGTDEATEPIVEDWSGGHRVGHLAGDRAIDDRPPGRR